MTDEQLLKIKKILNAEEMHYSHTASIDSYTKYVSYTVRQKDSLDYYIVTFLINEKRIELTTYDSKSLSVEQYRKIAKCCDLLGW